MQFTMLDRLSRLSERQYKQLDKLSRQLDRRFRQLDNVPNTTECLNT